MIRRIDVRLRTIEKWSINKTQLIELLGIVKC